MGSTKREREKRRLGEEGLFFFSSFLSLREAYHCGNVSSHRICLFLQVLQPLRDFVWLFLGGPPPGPAMLPKLVKPPVNRRVVQRVYLESNSNQKKLGVLWLWWVSKESYRIRAHLPNCSSGGDARRRRRVNACKKGLCNGCVAATKAKTRYTTCQKG
jgi:hypothetical protein